AIYPRDSTCPLGNETQRRAATIANRGLSATQCTALTRWRHSRMLRSSNTFVQHHYTQAMASAFFLLILFLAACLYDTGECLFLICFPDFARQLINEWGFLLAYLDYATWLPRIDNAEIHARRRVDCASPLSCCRNRDPATPAITRHHPAVYARQEYQRPQHTQIN